MNFSEFLSEKYKLVSEIETQFTEIISEDYAEYFGLDEAREKIGIETVKKWLPGYHSVLNDREVADSLGMSRVHARNVSMHIMKKLFKKMSDIRPDLSVTEIFLGVVDFFKLRDVEDYRNLYLALPNDVRSSLEKEMSKNSVSAGILSKMKQADDEN